MLLCIYGSEGVWGLWYGMVGKWRVYIACFLHVEISFASKIGAVQESDVIVFVRIRHAD